jgi:hypothetical protein
MNRYSVSLMFSAYLLLVVGLTGCVQTMSESVDLNQTPSDDKRYLKAYDQASRDAKVTVNFETRYTLDATYLSPDFRSEFSKRYEQLFDAPQPFLEEASNKVGFFVSLFSPERVGYDLTDELLWTIQLKTTERVHKPIMIKKLDQKARWKPFFPHVHNWSTEYLILFDVPAVSITDQMVGKNLMSLHFANSDAKTKLSW